jgi:hypothetical protein
LQSGFSFALYFAFIGALERFSFMADSSIKRIPGNAL